MVPFSDNAGHQGSAMPLNDKLLESYISDLDEAGKWFGRCMRNYENLKNDTEKGTMGGEIDTAVVGVILAHRRFSFLLELLEEQKPPLLFGGSIRKKRAWVLEHSRKNLQFMSAGLASIPQTFVDVANTKIAMQALNKGRTSQVETSGWSADVI